MLLTQGVVPRGDSLHAAWVHCLQLVQGFNFSIQRLLLTKGVVPLSDSLNAAGISCLQLVQVVNASCSQPVCHQTAYARQLACHLATVIPHAVPQALVQQHGVGCGSQLPNVSKVPAIHSLVENAC